MVSSCGRQGFGYNHWLVRCFNSGFHNGGYATLVKKTLSGILWKQYARITCAPPFQKVLVGLKKDF